MSLARSNDLVALLRGESFDSLELVKKKILSDSGGLLFDVVVCESATTPRTLIADEVFIGLRFGSDFERFVATLRAGKLDCAHKLDAPIVGDAGSVATSKKFS
jgi:hypothetical protein